MTNKPLKDFYDGAFRIALETQTPIKPVLFLDTYRRLSYNSIFSLTPGRCRILYCSEIPVQNYSIGDVGRLKKDVYDIMESKLIEFDGAWQKNKLL